jgi:hypothetical protein
MGRAYKLAGNTQKAKANFQLALSIYQKLDHAVGIQNCNA